MKNGRKTTTKKRSEGKHRPSIQLSPSLEKPIYIITKNLNGPHILALTEQLDRQKIAYQMQQETATLGSKFNQRFFVIVDNKGGEVVLGPEFGSILMTIVGYPRVGKNRKNHYFDKPKDIITFYEQFKNDRDITDRQKSLINSQYTDIILEASSPSKINYRIAVRSVSKYKMQEKEEQKMSQNSSKQNLNKQFQRVKLLIVEDMRDESYSTFVEDLLFNMNHKNLMEKIQIHEVYKRSRFHTKDTTFYYLTNQRYKRDLLETITIGQLIVFSNKSQMAAFKSIMREQKIYAICSEKSEIVKILQKLGIVKSKLSHSEIKTSAFKEQIETMVKPIEEHSSLKITKAENYLLVPQVNNEEIFSLGMTKDEKEEMVSVKGNEFDSQLVKQGDESTMIHKNNKSNPSRFKQEPTYASTREPDIVQQKKKTMKGKSSKFIISEQQNESIVVQESVVEPKIEIAPPPILGHNSPPRSEITPRSDITPPGIEVSKIETLNSFVNNDPSSNLNSSILSGSGSGSSSSGKKKIKRLKSKVKQQTKKPVKELVENQYYPKKQNQLPTRSIVKKKTSQEPMSKSKKNLKFFDQIQNKPRRRISSLTKSEPEQINIENKNIATMTEQEYFPKNLEVPKTNRDRKNTEVSLTNPTFFAKGTQFTDAIVHAVFYRQFVPSFHNIVQVIKMHPSPLFGNGLKIYQPFFNCKQFDRAARKIKLRLRQGSTTTQEVNFMTFMLKQEVVSFQKYCEMKNSAYTEQMNDFGLTFQSNLSHGGISNKINIFLFTQQEGEVSPPEIIDYGVIRLFQSTIETSGEMSAKTIEQLRQRVANMKKILVDF